MREVNELQMIVCEYRRKLYIDFCSPIQRDVILGVYQLHRIVQIHVIVFLSMI